MKDGKVTLKDLKEFFEAAPNGSPLSMTEFKSLTSESREELKVLLQAEVDAGRYVPMTV